MTFSHLAAGLRLEIEDFHEFGTCTERSEMPGGVPVYTNEFWTARQRAAHSLHEISYRACFKPQLPRFFIERLTQPGDWVYDPFSGRGTTALEAALLGRRVAANDLNPLSTLLARPRFFPPSVAQVERRLQEIDWMATGPDAPFPAENLLAFYHPATLQAIIALRIHLHRATSEGEADFVDDWIRLVATNRLTGHSPGFFSIYTLPPNQAVTSQRQEKINLQRGQTPPFRDVPALILKKTRALLRDLTAPELEKLRKAGRDARFATGSATVRSPLPDESIHLVITSPPFLNVVDYAGDNWLRCWFNGIDPHLLQLTQSRNASDWSAEMTLVFQELRRVLHPAGHIAFEVGEIHRGRVEMEDLVLPSALKAGLAPEWILVNAQHFTKTANCWGVKNRIQGTNTNRIILLKKEPADPKKLT